MTAVQPHDPTVRVLRLSRLLIAVLLAGALAGPRAAAQEAPEAGENKDGNQPTVKKVNGEDEAYRLLAERERARGPTFPGKDPAFLVLPRPIDRSTMALDLLTPTVKRMTEKGLTWLANGQDSDGGWSDTQFPSNTGVTALAVLAFMAEGSRPRIGRFGKQIDRGFEFILKNVQAGGVIAGGKGNNPYGPMYEHTISMLALLYAYGDMPWRPQTRDVIARGIQVIARSQRLDGGWRYQFSRDGSSDMSVTANVLWVLRTAKKAGFTVSAQSVKKGVHYVEQCARPDGTFRYRTWGLHAAPSLGGTGVIALCNAGRIDHELIAPARNRIAYDYRRYTLADFRGPDRRYVVYGCFYASLAMYMCGDEFWVPWFKKGAAVLAKFQRKDGEFFDEHDNTVYPTAMALLVLQAPYGYLPLYER